MSNSIHKAIPIYEAKTNLSKYIEQAKAGTPVYIGARGEAEVVLTVLPTKPKASLWGSLRGQIFMSEKAWDNATKEVNQDFEDALSKLEDLK
jgi:prevent-host-death family protein